MIESAIVWNEETLNNFLKAPLAMIPGTSMGFIGIESDPDRAQLVAYLLSLDSDHPDCR